MPWRPLQSHRGWQAKNYISQTSLQLGQQIQLWEQKANPGRALSLPLWAALCWSGTKGRGSVLALHSGVQHCAWCTKLGGLNHQHISPTVSYGSAET